MKYMIDCPHCGRTYEVESDFKPNCCLKCGSSIELEKPKTRIRAEEAMRKMDALKPRLALARKAYIDLMCEYERECQIVRGYARRGVVSPEEKERYMIKNVPELAKVSLTEAMKESAEQRGTSRPKKEKPE